MSVSDESALLEEYIQEEWEAFKVSSVNNGLRIDQRNEGEAFTLFMCGVLSGVNYPVPKPKKEKESD